MDANQEECLVDEREEMLMKMYEAIKPYKRKGWFLKPREYIPGKNLGVPFFPSIKRPSSDWLSKLAHKVTFKGWPNPQQNWEQWVEKLRPVYGDVWKKAGIFDAIHCSTCKIRRDLTSLWEVLSYWSSETNTFIFPFCEATVTLEDIMILGGFSPIGLCVRGVEPLTGELEEYNLHLVREQKSFNKSKAKKACFSAWMNHFMESNDGSIEHIAFLSLWLSRYVFPRAPGEVIQRELFPLAILMAQGKRFALGPAVLASLYRDLSLLKEQLTDSGEDGILPIFLWSPFAILQMWVWEHFLSLRQYASPKVIDRNKPWATRWHNLAINKIPFSGLVVESPQNFQWRPYASKLDNWNSPSHYKESGHWISSNYVKDEGSASFAQCLRVCELVGLDSIQHYLPHRVSRQFGYDQDLLGCVPVDARISDWEIAWAFYKKGSINFILYIPPRHFESDATFEYYSWWKENISISCSEIDIQTVEKDMEMERKEVAIPLIKIQKLQADLNTTPLVLNDISLELDELARCNVRMIKRLARKRKTCSSSSLALNHLTRYAHDGENQDAPDEEETIQAGFHRCKNVGHRTLDCGAKSSTLEDQEKYKRPKKKLSFQ